MAFVALIDDLAVGNAPSMVEISVFFSSDPLRDHPASSRIGPPAGVGFRLSIQHADLALRFPPERSGARERSMPFRRERQNTAAPVRRALGRFR
jgi:hypothetical protein